MKKCILFNVLRRAADKGLLFDAGQEGGENTSVYRELVRGWCQTHGAGLWDITDAPESSKEERDTLEAFFAANGEDPTILTLTPTPRGTLMRMSSTVPNRTIICCCDEPGWATGDGGDGDGDDDDDAPPFFKPTEDAAGPPGSDTVWAWAWTSRQAFVVRPPPAAAGRDDDEEQDQDDLDARIRAMGFVPDDRAGYIVNPVSGVAVKACDVRSTHLSALGVSSDGALAALHAWAGAASAATHTRTPTPIDLGGTVLAVALADVQEVRPHITVGIPMAREGEVHPVPWSSLHIVGDIRPIACRTLSVVTERYLMVKSHWC